MIASIQGPWIVGGDWNMSPVQLSAAGWPSLVMGSIYAPTEATSNDRTIDSFVVSRGLAGVVIAVAEVADAGASQHSPVCLRIRASTRSMRVRTLAAP